MRTNKLIKALGSMLMIAILLVLAIPTRVFAAEGDGTTRTYNRARVIISGYSYSTEKVFAGEEGTLTVYLKNADEVVPVENLVAYVSFSGNAVYPDYGSSNEVYVGQILPGETATATFNLKAVNKIDSEVIMATVGVKYTDLESLDVTDSVNIYIPVADEGGFEVFNYSVPSQAYVNVKSRVSASFTNSGKNGVKNVVLHIDGIDGNYNSVLEVGDLASGESNFVENYLTFGAANVEQKLTVYFTYDDNQGVSQTSEKKEYLVTVLDGSSNDEEVTEQATGEFVGPIEIDNSNNYVQYAIVIVLIIIVAATGIYVWRKKKD